MSSAKRLLGIILILALFGGVANAENKIIVLNTSTISPGTIVSVSSLNYPIPDSQWSLMNGTNDTRFTNIYNNVTYPHYKVIWSGRTSFEFRVNLTDGAPSGGIRWYYGNSSASDTSLTANESTIFSDNFSTNGLNTTWLGNTINFGISNGQLNMSVGVEARKAIYNQISAGIGTPINITVRINETASTNYHEAGLGVADTYGSSIQLSGNGISIWSMNYANDLWYWRKTIGGVATLLGNGGTPDYIWHTHNLKYDGTTWTYYLDGSLVGTASGIANFNESYIMLGDYSSLPSTMFWDDVVINTTSTIPTASTSVIVESGNWVLVASKNTSLTITDTIRNFSIIGNNVYFGTGDSA